MTLPKASWFNEIISINLKSFRWSICFLDFTQSSDLNIHTETVHKGKNFLLHSTSDQMVASKQILERHISTIQGEALPKPVNEKNEAKCEKIITNMGGIQQQNINFHENSQRKFDSNFESTQVLKFVVYLAKSHAW